MADRNHIPDPPKRGIFLGGNRHAPELVLSHQEHVSCYAAPDWAVDRRIVVPTLLCSWQNALVITDNPATIEATIRWRRDLLRHAVMVLDTESNPWDIDFRPLFDGAGGFTCYVVLPQGALRGSTTAKRTTKFLRAFAIAQREQRRITSLFIFENCAESLVSGLPYIIECLGEGKQVLSTGTNRSEFSVDGRTLIFPINEGWEVFTDPLDEGHGEILNWIDPAVRTQAYQRGDMLVLDRFGVPTQTTPISYESSPELLLRSEGRGFYGKATG